jgi:hypothetical protein
MKLSASRYAQPEQVSIERQENEEEIETPRAQSAAQRRQILCALGIFLLCALGV